MPRENGKVRSEYLLAVLMCIAVAFFLTILIVSNSCEKQSAEENTSSEMTSSSPEDSSADVTSEAKPPVAVETVPLASPARVAEGGLVPLLSDALSGEGRAFGGNLVNIYSTNASTRPSDSQHLYGYSGVKLELREDALKALNAMAEDFVSAKGKTNLMVDKANLSSAEGGAVEANLATGCAVLFSVYPADPDGDYLGSGKFLWLADNCTNYGFILRYPAEKASVTHEDGNARLFRYVGYEHAAYMGKYHLTLEEYLEAVRVYTAESPLEVSYTDVRGNERNCEVYFVAVSGGETDRLPIRGGESADFTYTGNGSDGIIVTRYID